ncbi:MAG: aspartate kinase [Acholeplasmatales bacterium]|nr:aspartate kinase [Acholeplasmatales bacterium]
MLKVCKFGGSSLSDSKQFKKVKDIVLSDPLRKVVVVSALGKRNKSDYKITDLLYILSAHIKYNVDYDSIWNLIYERFVGIRNDLKIDFDIENELNNLKFNLKKNMNEDYLVSRGEYLTAKLMSCYLGFDFVDARDVIAFQYNGKIDEKKTNELVQNVIKDKDNIVVPGFYGSYPNKDIKIMSRGGSDITGSLLAQALNASVYENFTDVSGILAADPRIVDNPRAISEVTYQELSELSYMGANVLHEETVYPVQQLNIPINILNTNEPLNKGTMIKNDASDSKTIVTGITGKKNYASITISRTHMSGEIGILKKALQIFEDYNLCVDHAPSGIDSFSLVVDYKAIEHNKYELIAKLKESLQSNVELDDDLALIAIVGRNMKNKLGVSGKIFSTLADNQINVKMMDQDPLEISIIVGVSNSSYEKSIKCLYDALIKD